LRPGNDPGLAGLSLFTRKIHRCLPDYCRAATLRTLTGLSLKGNRSVAVRLLNWVALDYCLSGLKPWGRIGGSWAGAVNPI